MNNSHADARVMLAGSDHKQAGFSVGVDPRGGRSYPAVFAPRRSGWDQKRLDPLPAVATFTMTWSPTGAKLRFDGLPQEIDLGIAPERLILSCSTGEAVFYKVTITSP